MGDAVREARERLTKYLDAVDESHRNPFQKSVSYVDHDAGTFALEVFKVADLRALLAAYADAARDRERLDWLERNTRVTESHEYPWPEAYRDESHSTLRAAIDAARTGEAR